MRVWLDPERIALRGLTAEQVLDALRAQNVQVAGGALGEPPHRDMNAFQVSLQMKGRLRDADEFENIVLKIGQDGRVVRVKDIGRVELGALSYTAYGYAGQLSGRSSSSSTSSRAPTPCAPRRRHQGHDGSEMAQGLPQGPRVPHHL